MLLDIKFWYILSCDKDKLFAFMLSCSFCFFSLVFLSYNTILINL